VLQQWSILSEPGAQTSVLRDVWETAIISESPLTEKEERTMLSTTWVSSRSEPGQLSHQQREWKQITIQVQNKEHLQHKIEISKKEKRRRTSRKLTAGGTSATAARKNQMTPWSTKRHQGM
jgi:hypothetical protein